MNHQSIFRKVSLDRLASPEKLDQLMQVTDPRGWIALSAAGGILVTALLWGVFGSLPEDVQGMGILIKSGGVYEVVPRAGGRVSDVGVSVGDVVTEGQVVARMEQTELSDMLLRARARLATLREKHEKLVETGRRNLALQRSASARQRAAAEQSMASARSSLRSYEEKVVLQERLVEEGLITRQTLLNSRQQRDASQEKIQDAQSQLALLSVRDLEQASRTDEEIRASQAALDEQSRQVAELASELRAKSEIVAPCTGRVLEVMSEEGSVVGAGQPVLSLVPSGRSVKDLEAVVYVPSVQGKQIRPGMQVLIAPTTVKKEEHGMMLGRVTYVSDFPATTRGMDRVLKNERLVAALSGSDAPYEVRADLVPDPGTPSGYKWSSSGGPPLRVQSGTLASANITVASRRPIELVIPLVRRQAGL